MTAQQKYESHILNFPNGTKVFIIGNCFETEDVGHELHIAFTKDVQWNYNRTSFVPITVDENGKEFITFGKLLPYSEELEKILLKLTPFERYHLVSLEGRNFI